MTQDASLKWNQAATIVGVIGTIVLIINILIILPVTKDLSNIRQDFIQFKSDNKEEHKEIQTDIEDLKTFDIRMDERLKTFKYYENNY